jgi:GNAT superfamily N-acetyltransferase
MSGKRKRQWLIRRATPADAKGICDLLFMLKTMYASTPAKTLQEFLPIHLPVVQRAIRLPDHPIFVAVNQDGALVGFISLTVRTVLRIPSPVGSLEEIFVRAEHRRKGVGTALWKAAAGHLGEAGVNRVEVTTSLAHPGQRPFAKSIGMEWYASVHLLNV